MLAHGIAALKRGVCVMIQLRELAAVAAALDAEPLGVDPRILLERGIDRRQDVLRLAAVLVARDRVRERLPVAGRAAVVDHQRRPAVRRRRPAPCGRTPGPAGRAGRRESSGSSDGARRRGVERCRLREERLDLAAVEVAEREGLDLAPPSSRRAGPCSASSAPRSSSLPGRWMKSSAGAAGVVIAATTTPSFADRERARRCRGSRAPGRGARRRRRRPAGGRGRRCRATAR